MTIPDVMTHAEGEDSPLLQSNEERIDSSISASYISRTSSSVRESISKRLFRSVSTQEREHALESEGVGPAAYLIRDAIRGEEESPYEAWYDPYSNPDRPTINTISLLSSRLTSYKTTVRLLKGVGWMLVLLSFVEPPYWCEARDQTCSKLLSLRGLAADGQKNVELYPNSNSMFLTREQSLLVEGFCLTFMSIYLLLRFGSDAFELQRFFCKGYKRRTHGLQCVLLAILFCGVGSGKTIFNPFFRIVLLGTYLKDFQKELRTVLSLIPQIMYILALLVILILFYAWFGVVLFMDSEQGKRDFSNIIEGCWTLWICVTTANYPDVMMPSYNNNRLSAIFFISFMVISFFFLMNIILASVIDIYDKAIEARKISRRDIARHNLTLAFHLMDPHNTGHIGRETIMAIFLILNDDFPDIRNLSVDERELLYGFLDKDGSSEITLEEFQDFGNVMLLEFTKESEYDTFVEIHLPSLFKRPGYKKLCEVVRSAAFEFFVEVVLVLNAIVIGIQSYPALAGYSVELDPHHQDGHIDTVWELMETLFTAFYVVEALLKIMVDGWKKYHESSRNMFDFCITVLALVATMYVYYPNAYSDSRLIRFIVMARVLRLARLLNSIPSFQMIGTISADILPAAANVITVLFFLMYLFSALGVILYGGMITRDPSNPLSYSILNTDFSDNDYWANNFNDMMSGMNVLFNLLVVNNWTECEIGFEAVTGGKWVRLFFLCFHLLGVIIINNVVIAFIINAFFQQLATIESHKTTSHVEGEASIQGRRAIFDGSEITGTKTGATGGYIARIRAAHADVEIDEREGLTRLFTRTVSSDAGSTI